MSKIILIVAFIFAAIAAHSSETAKGIQKDYDQFKKEMNVKLEATEKKIEELKDKSKSKTVEAQDKTVQELEKTRDELKAKLDEAKATGQSSWKSFKKSFAESVDKLNTKVQKTLDN